MDKRQRQLQDVNEIAENGHSSGAAEVEEVEATQYGSTIVLSKVTRTPKSMSRNVKLMKTLCMLLIYLGMGLWAGIISPTIVDMAELYHSSYENFISTSAVKSIGVMSGSFTGAFAADKFRPKADLSLFLCNFFGGLTMLCIPWSPSYILMGFLFFINGLCHGTLNVVCSSVNIAIWGENAPTPVTALHMFFTIGTTIAPPLAVPFLSKDNATYNDAVAQNGTHPGHVRVPYVMFGIYSMIVSLLFLAFFLKKLYYVSDTVKKRETLQEMLNPGNLAGGDFKYGLYFLASLFILYFFMNGKDRPMGMFLFLIAHTDILHLSKPLSAGLVTAYNLSQALGRGASAFISRYFTTQSMLFSQILISTLLQMFQILYALNSAASLFLTSCLYGLFSGPMYPTLIGWTDRYIEATGTVIAVIDIGIGVGGFVATIALGHINQNHASLGVFLFGFIYSIILLLVLIPLQIVAHKKGDRHKIKHSSTHIVQGINAEYEDFRVPENDTAQLLPDDTY